MPRTCIGCIYWTFDPGHAAWSDVTPGDLWSSGCDKRHWFLVGWRVRQEQYRASLLLAEVCPDYTEDRSTSAPASPPLPGVSEEEETEAPIADWPTVLPDDDGIRPAGKPDQCFYCNARVGESHEPECVIVTKEITARYIFEVPVRVPWYWGKEEFEFRHNESSSCANNVVRFDLAKAIGRDGCLCRFARAEYVGVIDETPRRHTKAESCEDNKLVREWAYDDEDES